MSSIVEGGVDNGNRARKLLVEHDTDQLPTAERLTRGVELAAPVSALAFAMIVVGASRAVGINPDRLEK